MTLKPIILFVAFTLSSFKVAAQLLFAPSTNTPVIEYPYDAVELPGNRYALSIAKRTGVLPNDYSFMELVITDSVGAIEHYVMYPGDSSVNIYPRDLFYKDGVLYSVALLDSVYQSPRFLHISAWDTALNQIYEKVHSICDSGWFIVESYSEIYGDYIYSIESRAAVGDDVGNVTHPLISKYDLNGDLYDRKEIDTTFFSQFAGGDNYTVIIEDLSVSSDGAIYFSFPGGRIGGGIGGYIEQYIARTDTGLNLQSLGKFACWDAQCDTTYGGYYAKRLWAASGSTVYGLFLTTAEPPLIYRNGLTKMSLPAGMFNNAYKPETLTLIPDNTMGVSFVKILGRETISAFQDRIFSLGMDYHSFSPAVNHLIISRSDTNGQIVWTKYLPSDGRPFEPRFILATSDGGCLVAASVLDGLTNPYDHYIFKLDGNGHFTSVHRLELEKERVVKVYPNPASSVLNFELDKAGEYSIDISDMNGRRVLQHKVKGVSQTFDVRHLAEGMYQYAVYGAEGVIDSGLWLKR